MASNAKKRQFSSSTYSRFMAEKLPSNDKLEAYDIPQPQPIAATAATAASAATAPIPNLLSLMTPNAATVPTSAVAPPVRMGISIPTSISIASADTNAAQTSSIAAASSSTRNIQVKCLLGRTNVYQPLPNLKGNFLMSSTGFAKAMRNHIWGEHVFMFEQIPDSDDWATWATCADTHATADEWLEVILPGFELNGVAWFIVRGIDPETGSLQFYFCPRNDPRGNPILGEFGSMPKFDTSQVSIIDGKV